MPKTAKKPQDNPEVVEEILEAVAEELQDIQEEEAQQEVPGDEAETTAEGADPDLAITQEDVRLVEAILFAATSPVGVAQIAERFPEDRVSLIPDILEIIQQQYEGRGVNLVQRDKKYALRTASDLGDSLRLEKEQPKKFTRAAQETMAVIAYHQPVTRAEIENIRGVATSPGSLDALLEAGWIKTGKRREVPGRPVTWLTTQAFLDHFGLEALSDLPGMDELKAAGLLDKRPAIEAMPSTGDLFGDDGDITPEITDEDLIGSALDDDEEEAEDAEEEDFDDEDTRAEASDDFDEDTVDSDDDDDADDDDYDDEDDYDDDEDDEDDDE